MQNGNHVCCVAWKRPRLQRHILASSFPTRKRRGICWVFMGEAEDASPARSRATAMWPPQFAHHSGVRPSLSIDSIAAPSSSSSSILMASNDNGVRACFSSLDSMLAPLSSSTCTGVRDHPRRPVTVQYQNPQTLSSSPCGVGSGRTSVMWHLRLFVLVVVSFGATSRYCY